MSIDPAMLVLSAANPALLPLAIGMSRSPYPNGHTVRHEHKVEHSVKPGTGQELRGVSVDPQRAAKAFKLALNTIEEIKVECAQYIASADKGVEEYNHKIRRDKDAEWQKYHDRAAESDAAREEVRRLEDLAKSKFWGLSPDEKADLRRAKQKASYDSLWSMPSLSDFSRKSLTEEINEVTDRIKQQYVRCAVALDCMHLDPSWAEAVFYIEEDARDWLSKFHVFHRLFQ